jgi:hypothetical protein
MTNLRLTLDVDSYNQWFVDAWVEMHGRKIGVRFKVDNGCNGLVLSHKTLRRLGYSTTATDLSALQDITGRLANGEITSYKGLGAVSLYADKLQTVHICTANAICHATRETRDLMGTEVLRQFCGVNFWLSGNKYMELLKT